MYELLHLSLFVCLCGVAVRLEFDVVAVADQHSSLQMDTAEVVFDIQRLRVKGRRGLLHFKDEMEVHGKPLKRMRSAT